MKKLKRIAVGQLSDLERISKEELRTIVGGSMCVWDCLAYIKDCYDGDPFTSNKKVYGYADNFKSSWRSYMTDHGHKVRDDGDPAANQSEDLYDFISQEFHTTTGDSWGMSDWRNMIGCSGAHNKANGCTWSGMALVIIGDETNQHALVISGSAHEDQYGRQYYDCYDPDQRMSRVYVSDIRYGTGIGIKND